MHLKDFFKKLMVAVKLMMPLLTVRKFHTLTCCKTSECVVEKYGYFLCKR
jgi:hypothetical protein